jgi:Tfp pilus assembly protein FimT
MRSSRSRSPRGDGGFSIPELMTGMTLFATLFAIAQPSLSAMFGGIDLSRATREVYGEVQRARAEAIMRNTRCRIALDDRGELAVSRYDTTESSWEDLSTQLVGLEEEANVQVDATGDIVFAPNGTAASAASIVVEGADGRTKTVVVEVAGTIRIL